MGGKRRGRYKTACVLNVTERRHKSYYDVTMKQEMKPCIYSLT